MKKILNDDIFVEGISSDTISVDADHMICKRNKGISNNIKSDIDSIRRKNR